MNARWVVVGAGFTGAVLAERIASVLDQDVLLIDRRDHIAGNAFDFVHESGILHHRYGPHVFHTNSERVWHYLSRFTRWRPYQHRVRALVEGNLVPVPFNLDSVAACFPGPVARRLSAALIDAFGYGRQVPILKLRCVANAELRSLADYVYENVFRHYTRKQWGLAPEDLDPGVTGRVPVRIDRDDRYFQDRYQGLPVDGYTALFARLVAHERIEVRLSTPFEAIRDACADRRIVFTGPIDQFFDYAHGALPYRSVEFRLRTRPGPGLAQPVGTVNYPNDHDFTRVTELRHLTGQHADRTLLCEEHPCAHRPGVNEPYYPVPSAETARRLEPYRREAAALAGRVWFAGRLGDYAYYNMDQACARALSLFDKQIRPRSEHG